MEVIISKLHLYCACFFSTRLIVQCFFSSTMVGCAFKNTSQMNLRTFKGLHLIQRVNESQEKKKNIKGNESQEKLLGTTRVANGAINLYGARRTHYRKPVKVIGHRVRIAPYHEQLVVGQLLLPFLFGFVDRRAGDGVLPLAAAALGPAPRLFCAQKCEQVI